MFSRSGFSFRKNFQIKSLLLSTMSSQCRLPPEVGIEGEVMLKKSLSHKIFERGLAFLLTVHCLALSKGQSSYVFNVQVTWIPRSLVVEWVMVLDGFPSSTFRSLMFFLQGGVADCTISSCISHRSLMLVTQPLHVLI